MKSTFVVAAALTLGVSAFLAGTAFSGDDVEKKKASQSAPPPPPAELKALNAFVGKWRGEYEHMPAMFGAAVTGTGKGETVWVLDGWFIKGEGTGTSSYGTHKSIWLMTYDPMMKSYRSFSFDNFGTCEVAMVKRDPRTGAWIGESDGFDFVTGKPNKSTWIMHFLSEDKMEWQWHIKGEGQADFELMMKGTDTRVSEKPGA